ncbi:MAG: TldD/PmbA family protein [Bacteroidales bacterium]
MNVTNDKELAQWLVDITKKKGASDAEVSISSSKSTEVEIRKSKVEKIQENIERGLSLKIFIDGKYSSHSTNRLNKSDLEKFVDEGVAMTKYLEADEFRVLTDPKFYPTEFKDLKTCNTSVRDINTDQRKKIAQELEDAALAESDKVISATGSVYDWIGNSVKINSNGFNGSSDWSGVQMYCGVSMNDGDAKPEGGDYAYGRALTDLPSAETIGRNATRNTARKLGQEKIKSGKYDMLVENKVASRLLSQFFGPMRASAIQQKSSFLDNMKGKQIASKLLSVVDDPLIVGALASCNFDADCIASKKRVMIEKGVLMDYYIDNYYGRKLGWIPNGGATSNLLIDLGSRSINDITKDIKNGIIVTSFNGGNNNDTTGDFSYGVSGLLIENGIITKPINEMNITGNAKDLWQRLVELGNDPFKYSSVQIPCMLFEGIEFSGL